MERPKVIDQLNCDQNFSTYCNKSLYKDVKYNVKSRPIVPYKTLTHKQRVVKIRINKQRGNIDIRRR